MTDVTCRYRLSAVQLASALPEGSAGVVDGEVTVRSSTDEQRRLTTVTTYDLHLSQASGGSYATIVTALTPATGSPGAAQLLSQSVEVSRVHEFRLHCTFTQLGNADGSPLLEYSRTVRITAASQSYEVYVYPGISPIAVARPLTFAKIDDSGSMSGLAEYVLPPNPLTAYHDSEPNYAFTDVSNYQKKTDWQYSVWDLDGTVTSSLTTLLAAITRGNVNTSSGSLIV